MTLPKLCRRLQAQKNMGQSTQRRLSIQLEDALKNTTRNRSKRKHALSCTKYGQLITILKLILTVFLIPLLETSITKGTTRERLAILDDFYGKIFDITGNPDSIIDHACGLNPLSVLWMGLPDNTKYYAFDIESNLVEFLVSVIGYLGLHDKMEAQMGDILVDEFNYADVVFMLKFLPVIEQQEKGSSLKVMKKQKCRYLVVSFPVKSLSGVEKGMASFYSNWFRNLIKEENWQYNEILFDSELVFVVQKHLETQI
jgi:16S rRNA (guanine(1405)-N(7))-methyltransferase